MVNSVSGVITILTMILSCVKMVISIILRLINNISISFTNMQVNIKNFFDITQNNIIIQCTGKHKAKSRIPKLFILKIGIPKQLTVRHFAYFLEENEKRRKRSIII